MILLMILMQASGTGSAPYLGQAEVAARSADYVKCVDQRVREQLSSSDTSKHLIDYAKYQCNGEEHKLLLALARAIATTLPDISREDANALAEEHIAYELRKSDLDFLSVLLRRSKKNTLSK